MSLSPSGSVESDPQCPEALTFPDSSFGHQPPFYRYSNNPLSPCDPYSSASISRPQGAAHTHSQVQLIVAKSTRHSCNLLTDDVIPLLVMCSTLQDTFILFEAFSLNTLFHRESHPLSKAFQVIPVGSYMQLLWKCYS